MLFNTKSAALASFAFASLGSAHLKLMRPVPYGIDTLNKSPLNNVAPGSSGSDFPCKLRTGVYDIAMMNNFTVGDPQELSFIGSVSHGGGTCQLAITKDQKPTASSVFKVFQVFEGGCPVNSDGNTGTHPFTFVLPKDMPNGVMTFAWIWYNRIGDREIYMNCAPVTVSGGSTDDTYFNSLPNAYIINLPTSECQSTFQEESNAVTIPHPGQYILKSFEGQQMHVATGPNCSAAAAAQLDGVVGYKSNVVTSNGAKYQGLSGKLPAVPHASSGAAGSAAAPATSMAAGTSGSAGSKVPALGFGTSSGSVAGGGASEAAAASGTSTSSSIAASSPAANTGTFTTLSVTGTAGVFGANTATAGTATVTSATASAAASSGSACSSTGAAITCSSDGKKFGVCSDGKMVWRAVAPGTTCSNGQITKRGEIRKPRGRRSA